MEKENKPARIKNLKCTECGHRMSRDDTIRENGSTKFVYVCTECGSKQTFLKIW